MAATSNGLANAVAYAFDYADAATREAATGFTSADVGKLARQLDDNTLWLLTATTPTWAQVGGGGGTARGARVYNSANISITTGLTNFQALTFDSTRYDTDGIHSTSSNIGRLTCRTAGAYAISGSVQWAAHNTGMRWIGIRLNGTTSITALAHPAVQSEATYQSITTQWTMAVGDYVELIVAQNSGGALNVIGAGDLTAFMMSRIG